jgi:hypothetical protein
MIRSEERWSAELGAVSVRAGGLEREVREAGDVVRRLRMELAARDAEVAALEARVEGDEAQRESAASEAERGALGTVLAQSRLVAVLDRQRVANEALITTLRAELEAARGDFHGLQSEALEWKTRALRAEGGEEPVSGDEGPSTMGALRQVASAELESFLQGKLSYGSSRGTFEGAASRLGAATGVPARGGGGLSESLQRDLLITQRRLDELQTHSKATILTTRTLPMPMSMQVPAMNATRPGHTNMYASPAYGAARSRAPKSDVLRQWFQENAHRLG